MKQIDRVSRSPKARRSHANCQSAFGTFAIVALLLTPKTGLAQTPVPTPAIASPSQNPASTTPAKAASVVASEPAPAILKEAQPNTQDGYVIRQTVDLGGHLAFISGSGAMYNTVVNLHSGPRVAGQTFEMHAISGTKHRLFDTLTAFSGGFGGDPNNFAKLDFSKGKLYEFSGVFRRDRQYFDYDLLSNPLIPSGVTSPIGTPTSNVLYTFPQVNYSPVLFNSVRRMTDTNLTIFPLSKVTMLFGYSQNIFQGPSYSSVHLAGEGLLLQNLRNSDDTFLGELEWKPLQATQIRFQELVVHYKEDTSYSLAPIALNLQLSNGTPVSLGYDNVTPPVCSDGRQPIQVAAATAPAPTGTGGLTIAPPTVDPTCAGYISFTRSQPTRAIFPTEVLHFQSASIKHIEANGNVRYTVANSNLPNYNEYFNGITGTTRFEQVTGIAHTRRIEVGADFGILWLATRTISLSDQYDFADERQPGLSSVATQTYVTAKTPTSSESMLNDTVTTTGPGTPTIGNTYFGQKVATNNATVTWDASLRATISLTYRYRTRAITTTNMSGSINATTGVVVVNIQENGGILNLALRPTPQWRINGSVEVIYDNNAFTAVSPRETQHYRLHTIYNPKTWATLSGTFSDLERHNNQDGGFFVANPALAGAGTTFTGGSLALDHVDHSRSASVGMSVAPNEHFGIDLNYAYTDVYTSTNICFNTGQVASSHGALMYPSVVTNTPCPVNVGASNDLAPTTVNPEDEIKDFMDAPTQYVSLGLSLSPIKAFHAGLGYRISSVSGNQTFLNPRNVMGSLQSAYQSPYASIAWTIHPSWVWKADYIFYSYGEGGPSGPSLCQATENAGFIPCPLNAPFGPTSPRNFHANLLTLAMHYEF